MIKIVFKMCNFLKTPSNDLFSMIIFFVFFFLISTNTVLSLFSEKEVHLEEKDENERFLKEEKKLVK